MKQNLRITYCKYVYSSRFVFYFIHWVDGLRKQKKLRKDTAMSETETKKNQVLSAQ